MERERFRRSAFDTSWGSVVFSPMSHLRKVQVPLTYGVVAKVTTEGQGNETWVTVEALHPDEKKAYRFQYLGLDRPKKGDAVVFTGVAKVEHHRGRPKYAKYYHDPMDGSERAFWHFADLVGASCARVGKWELIKSGLKVREDLEFVLRGDMSGLSERLKHVRAYARALEALIASAEDEFTDSASAP